MRDIFKEEPQVNLNEVQITLSGNSEAEVL